MKGKLYLIPTNLSENSINVSLPTEVIEIAKRLKYFIVENIRSARRFLKIIDKNIDIAELHFEELNEHTIKELASLYIKPLLDGFDVGIVSEAGCPAIADPGAEVVKIAHRHNIKVVPLVGPSSILLSLMSSGFNGQSFAFNGYLPIEKKARINRLKLIENRVYNENQTQIFIETPYRNNSLLEDMINVLKPLTLLSVACEITSEREFIKTMSIAEWKKEKADFNKKPAIFLIYK